MSEIMKKAYSEIDGILQLLQNDFVEKVPLKLRDFFSKEKDKNYNPNINPNIPLEEQQLPEVIKKTSLVDKILKFIYKIFRKNK